MQRVLKKTPLVRVNRIKTAIAQLPKKSLTIRTKPKRTLRADAVAAADKYYIGQTVPRGITAVPAGLSNQRREVCFKNHSFLQHSVPAGECEVVIINPYLGNGTLWHTTVGSTDGCYVTNPYHVPSQPGNTMVTQPTMDFYSTVNRSMLARPKSVYSDTTGGPGINYWTLQQPTRDAFQNAGYNMADQNNANKHWDSRARPYAPPNTPPVLEFIPVAIPTGRPETSDRYGKPTTAHVTGKITVPYNGQCKFFALDGTKDPSRFGQTCAPDTYANQNGEAVLRRYQPLMIGGGTLGVIDPNYGVPSFVPPTVLTGSSESATLSFEGVFADNVLQKHVPMGATQNYQPTYSLDGNWEYRQDNTANYGNAMSSFDDFGRYAYILPQSYINAHGFAYAHVFAPTVTTDPGTYEGTFDPIAAVCGPPIFAIETRGVIDSSPSAATSLGTAAFAQTGPFSGNLVGESMLAYGALALYIVDNRGGTVPVSLEISCAQGYSVLATQSDVLYPLAQPVVKMADPNPDLPASITGSGATQRQAARNCLNTLNVAMLNGGMDPDVAKAAMAAVSATLNMPTVGMSAVAPVTSSFMSKLISPLQGVVMGATNTLSKVLDAGVGAAGRVAEGQIGKLEEKASRGVEDMVGRTVGSIFKDPEDDVELLGAAL